MKPNEEILIVGNGIISLSIAFKLTLEGKKVTVVGKNLTGKATSVAAGMLAPVGELAFEDSNHTEFNLKALCVWKSFAQEILKYTKAKIGFSNSQSLLVAYSPDDTNYLKRLQDLYNQLGLKSQWLSPSKLRNLNGYLCPEISSGILTTTDWQVDNRLFYKALQRFLRSSKVSLINSIVRKIKKNNNGFELTLDDNTNVFSPCVVIAAGSFSSQIEISPPVALPYVYPVVGQTIRLKPIAKLPSYMIRGFINGKSLYIVNRTYETVIGATSKDAGFNNNITLGDFSELLELARLLLPVLDDAIIADISSGFRPATLDHLPFVGELDENLYCAYGHYRNGILQAPITAEIIACLINKKPLFKEAHYVSPTRIKKDGG
jgi:glycine oxidase